MASTAVYLPLSAGASCPSVTLAKKMIWMPDCAANSCRAALKGCLSIFRSYFAGSMPSAGVARAGMLSTATAPSVRFFKRLIEFPLGLV